MKTKLLILSFASLAFLTVGCEQETLSSLGNIDQQGAESSSEGDASSSSSEKISSSEEKSSSSKKSVAVSTIPVSYGELVDERDGSVYKTVAIGEQTWMAENLNYETEYSFCYNDSQENCEKHGRLYLWSAAMDSVGKFTKSARGCGSGSKCSAVWPVRGICPEGWHLPSWEDAQILIAMAGGSQLAGDMLKSPEGWFNGGGGAGMYGFSVTPSGMLNEDGVYQNKEGFSYFWTSTGNTADAYVVGFGYDRSNVDLFRYYLRAAFPVRCVKNEDGMTNAESSSSAVTVSPSSIVFGSFTDSRDDQTYKTVVIGEQVWMAQNLNYECEKSYCYNNSFENCDKYGRFYDWSMAQDICPKGWHLPDTAEWNELIDYAGGMRVAGLSLRSVSGWKQGIVKGTDAYGFSALPAGRRDSEGTFTEGYWNYPEYTYYWSSVDYGNDYGYCVYVTSLMDVAGQTFYYKNDYRSVRCVRDEPASSSSEKISSSSAKSSSSVSPASSDGRVVDRTFLWDGYIDVEGKVETGSPDVTAGYWYNYDDRNDGGSSGFIFPPDIEENTYGNFFGPLVEAYLGIKASVVLGEGYETPYAGLGFNVWSEDQEGVDVSAWGGICIAYKSTIAFSIELGIEDEATVTEYIKYRVSVPEATTISVIDFPWSKFKPRVWGPVASIEDVLKKVAAIKLKFEGEAGTTGDFVIRQIGSLGQCTGVMYDVN